MIGAAMIAFPEIAFRSSRLLTLCAGFCIAACSGSFDQAYGGEYVWGPEVHTFRPCGSDETYWVSASSWTIAPVREFYEAETDAAYAPIYIRFRGHLLDETVGGFAVSYSGLIRISEVHGMNKSVPEECH